MKSIKFEGKWLHDLNAELNGSDRACAVLAGAILDERINGLLKAYLLPPKKTNDDRLLGRSGAIQTFCSRIELAERLNLISESMASSLHWVRDIRNKAAHDEDFCLESNSHKDKINNLVNELNIKEKAESLLNAPYDSVRGNFISVAIMLIISIELEMENTVTTTYQPIDPWKSATITDNG